MTTLLIDGTNMAYRARYTTDGLSFKGKDTSVLFGVIKMIVALIKKFKPESVMVAWDAGTPLYRRLYVPTYKVNRKHEEDPTYPAFLAQLSELKCILPNFGVLSVSRAGTEADDLLHQASLMCKDDTIIISTDGDLIQSVSHKCSVYNPRDDSLLDMTSIELNANRGYCNRSTFLMMKTIMGDSSDNIPGVSGVGPKTAMKMLSGLDSELTQGSVDCEPFLCFTEILGTSTGRKLGTFIESGDYEKTFKVMDLNPDRTGARHSILNTDWVSYSHSTVMKWCMKNGFATIIEGGGPAIVFTPLQKPSFDAGLLPIPIIWDYRRFPLE